MNQITLTGNVGHSAQSKNVENGGLVTFSLGVSERKKNEQGEYETTRVDWFNCIIPTSKKETADKLASIITSGAKIALTGKMQSREYEKDGQKHIGWSVKVEIFEIMTTRKDKPESPDAPGANPF